MAGSTLSPLTEQNEHRGSIRGSKNAVCPLGYTNLPFTTPTASGRCGWKPDIRTRFLRELGDWSANAGMAVLVPADEVCLILLTKLA
jgi:hypothetical protein